MKAKFKHRLAPDENPLPEPPVAVAEPAEIEVRLGLREIMTSKGPSQYGNRWVRPGVIISLPRTEAENLLNLGYATRVE